MDSVYQREIDLLLYYCHCIRCYHWQSLKLALCQRTREKYIRIFRSCKIFVIQCSLLRTYSIMLHNYHQLLDIRGTWNQDDLPLLQFSCIYWKVAWNILNSEYVIELSGNVFNLGFRNNVTIEVEYDILFHFLTLISINICYTSYW